jgi:hypothetical protein
MANVKEMLLIGQDCGLETLSEAYQNYMGHYDAFFSIENFETEMKEFINEMTRIGFVTHEIPSEYTLVGNLKIGHCLKMYDAWERAGRKEV